MIETLDKYVLKVLDSLQNWKMPDVPIKQGFNLFIGSGNAFQVAKIYANHFGGIVTDTTNYRHFFKYSDRFDTKIIVSASGGKEREWIETAQAFAGDCTLLTCAQNPPLGQYVKKIITFPCMQDPPSYNTSTYASMIHALDPKEDISKIREYIKKLQTQKLFKYSFIPVISADENEPIAQMCATKIRETLGIGSVGKSIAEGMHGWFLHDRKDEVALCLNLPEFAPAKNKIHVNYNSNLGLILSAYYIIGKSQTDKLSQEILDNYKKVSAATGWKFGNVV
ncbi:Uncharacterised protein [uncultured archaeon]|nr:Uncharacterised protein [uncultured archaeon]